MVFLVKRGSKYGAKSTIFNGRSYMSKKEAGFAQQLEILKKASDPRERVVKIVPQYPVDLHVYGKKICRYYPDFYVEYANGDKKIFEVKGFATAVWQLKWKLFCAIYENEFPDIELIVIK